MDIQKPLKIPQMGDRNKNDKRLSLAQGGEMSHYFTLRRFGLVVLILTNVTILTSFAGNSRTPYFADAMNGQVTAATATQINRKDTAPAVSSQDLVPSPTGHPIVVAVHDGRAVLITSASLVKLPDGATLSLRPNQTNATSEFNGGRLFDGDGLVLPDIPLEPDTQYQTIVVGTDDGIAFSRTFTFLGKTLRHAQHHQLLRQAPPNNQI